MAGVGEIAALAVYVQFWWPEIRAGSLPGGGGHDHRRRCNLLSVKLYGSSRPGPRAVKVLAILLFLGAGIVLVVAGDVFDAPPRRP
ncbi:hypothetical protein QJS66_10205 [Kocuria rhizophila]|nr:hypothetical protein QJS66_10205 [Kocuria rhizophila]